MAIFSSYFDITRGYISNPTFFPLISMDPIWPPMAGPALGPAAVVVVLRVRHGDPRGLALPTLAQQLRVVRLNEGILANEGIRRSWKYGSMFFM
jgi:hypothetical protein